MIPVSQLSDYLREQSLELDRTELQIAVLTLSAVLSADKPAARQDLYRYRVPKLSEDGSCSLFEELAEEPYDLAPLFGGESPEATAALRNLLALVESVNLRVGADWLGVYRKIGRASRPSWSSWPIRACPAAPSFR